MPLPSIQELCLKTALYESLKLKAEDVQVLRKLTKENFKLDAFCVDCRAYSIFDTRRSSGGGAGLAASVQRTSTQLISVVNRVYTVEVWCAREHNHKMIFYFLCQHGSLIKIGQYPSLADFAGSELRRYKQILGSERTKELHRAQGLAAHGVGVGSFVYLRRVFESLLEECRQQRAQGSADIADYERLRVDERIKALSDVLPPFLVENSSVYQILSTGLHELDENTCLKYFPVVRDGIILMLEQDFRNSERRRIEDQARADIQQITSSIRSHKSGTQKKS